MTFRKILIKPTQCLPCLLGALFVFALAVSGSWWILRTSSSEEKMPMVESTLDDVVSYGQNLLGHHRSSGMDLDNGPCLDNAKRFPDWAIDVAHSPRQPVDDLPENQCAAYRDGSAKHFLELSPDGALIRSH